MNILVNEYYHCFLRYHSLFSSPSCILIELKHHLLNSAVRAFFLFLFFTENITRCGYMNMDGNENSEFSYEQYENKGNSKDQSVLEKA